MRSLIYTFALLFIFSQNLFAGNGYEEAMKKGIEDLYQAKGPKAVNQSANYFERIATAEPEQWLPHYYAAYARINLAAMQQSDEQLDLAQKHLDQITSQDKDESELVALQGYLYMIRVSIDPATRGQELAPKATQTLSKAAQMNPKNPRPLVLLAQMEYGTAQFFQSDTGEACKKATQALVLFEHQKEVDGLQPAWGKGNAEALSAHCDKP